MPPTPFPYQLAAFDLDGTLLGPDKTISAANRAALGLLRERGVQIVLASGRRHQNSVRFYEQLGLDTLLVSCSGAMIKNPVSNDTVREMPLTPALADELVAGGLAGGFTVVYYHRDHLYSGGSDRWIELYESRVGERTERHPDLRELHGAAALKVVWYGEPSVMAGRRRELEEKYKGRATIVATDAENLEFFDPHADKATALKVVAALYQVEPAAVMTFGDGENDAPMLRWAGLGVAVDGANAVAKAAAKVVGPAGCPEESVARAVGQIIDGFVSQPQT